MDLWKTVSGDSPLRVAYYVKYMYGVVHQMFGDVNVLGSQAK